jgi:hypothetical protein
VNYRRESTANNESPRSGDDRSPARQPAWIRREDPHGTLMIASIRYLDQFARQSDGSWLFAERKLMVDWTETRPSNP